VTVLYAGDSGVPTRIILDMVDVYPPAPASIVVVLIGIEATVPMISAPEIYEVNPDAPGSNREMIVVEMELSETGPGVSIKIVFDIVDV
jgi:hypothetical protein